ncbi:MAG: Arm DNA-binding domain-containing protein, partial [Pusillimonas sp.]
MMSNKLNFTKAALSALPIPSTGRVEYSDLKVPGLVIRVTANGVKTFSVFRRVRGGKPTRQTIGKFPDVSIEQARQRALTVVSQLAQGVDVSEQRLAAARVLRFSELFVRYMAEHSRIKKITWKEDEAQYRL